MPDRWLKGELVGTCVGTPTRHRGGSGLARWFELRLVDAVITNWVAVAGPPPSPISEQKPFAQNRVDNCRVRPRTPGAPDEILNLVDLTVWNWQMREKQELAHESRGTLVGTVYARVASTGTAVTSGDRINRSGCLMVLLGLLLGSWLWWSCGPFTAGFWALGVIGSWLTQSARHRKQPPLTMRAKFGHGTLGLLLIVLAAGAALDLADPAQLSTCGTDDGLTVLLALATVIAAALLAVSWPLRWVWLMWSAVIFLWCGRASADCAAQFVQSGMESARALMPRPPGANQPSNDGSVRPNPRGDGLIESSPTDGEGSPESTDDDSRGTAGARRRAVGSSRAGSGVDGAGGARTGAVGFDDDGADGMSGGGRQVSGAAGAGLDRAGSAAAGSAAGSDAERGGAASSGAERGGAVGSDAERGGSAGSRAERGGAAGSGAERGGAAGSGAERGGAAGSGAERGGAAGSGAERGGAAGSGAERGGAAGSGAERGGAAGYVAERGGAAGSGAERGGAAGSGAERGGAAGSGAERGGAAGSDAERGGAAGSGAERGGAAGYVAQRGGAAGEGAGRAGANAAGTGTAAAHAASSGAGVDGAGSAGGATGAGAAGEGAGTAGANAAVAKRGAPGERVGTTGGGGAGAGSPGGARGVDNGTGGWALIDGEPSAQRKTAGTTVEAALRNPDTFFGGAQSVVLPSDLLFEFDEHEIRPKATPKLNQLAKLLRLDIGKRIVLEGHADTIGGDQYNQTLSERRAEAVRRWLIDNAHINPSQIDTVGFGSSRPIVSGSRSPTEQRANRRVEVRVMQ